MPKCGTDALQIKTHYAGKNQCTHPNVVVFPKPWNGYRYYMAFTPLPFGNGSEENPSVAASNDLIHWDNLPDKNAIRPIAWCEETACDELKDTHLLYRSDLDRIELWYLGRINSCIQEKGPLYVFRKTSVDGKQWSEYEVMFSFDGFNLASPSVLWNGKSYSFWGIRGNKGLHYCEVFDNHSHSPFQECRIPGVERTDIWHGSVEIIDGKYTFVWVGNRKGTNEQIFYAESSDGLHFSDYQRILSNDSGWQFLYRPCLIKENDQFHLFYGVITHENRWLICKSSGPTLHALAGYQSESPHSDYRPTSRSRRIKQAFDTVTASISFRFMLLLPLIFLLHFFIPIHPLLHWGISVGILAFCCILLRFRKWQEILCASVLNGTLLCCISTWFCTIIRSIF